MDAELKKALDETVQVAKTKLKMGRWNDASMMFLAALLVMEAERGTGELILLGSVEEVAEKKRGRPRKEADAVQEP